MKVKTSEATGVVLDWLVAKCEEPVGGYKAWVQVNLDKGIVPAGVHADDWLTGGPIIEREKLEVTPDEASFGWLSRKLFFDNADDDYMHGPTPLIAAMRCYCCSKLGNIVDVPEELCQQQRS